VGWPIEKFVNALNGRLLSFLGDYSQRSSLLFYPFARGILEIAAGSVVYTILSKADITSTPWYTLSKLVYKSINLTFVYILLINLLIYIVIEYSKVFFIQINTTVTTN
jgi:hypothetical protein